MSPLSARLSTTFVSVAVAVACWASRTPAEIIAYDSGANYTKNQAYVGLNRGTGFGTWTLAGGTGTNKVGNQSRFNQIADTGGTPYIISRGINVPLAVGDTLSLTLEVENAKKTGGGARILFYAAGAQAAELKYFFGDQTWQWQDGSGYVSTGVRYVKNAVLTVSFTRTSSTAGYLFSLAQIGETTYNKTGTITGNTSAIDQLQFSARTLTTPQTTLYYDTLQVQSVPEPSAIAMLATAAVGGRGLAHLRQRRRHLRAAACPAPLPLAA